jgi:hypothetical protein
MPDVTPTSTRHGTTPAATPEHDPVIQRAERILSGDIRPEDYLPVTPEVRAAVDRDLEFARRRLRGEPDPEVAARQLRQRLLSVHHGGENVAYLADDLGVVVLAIGLRQVAAVLAGIPYENRKKLVVAFPDADTW